MKIKIATIRITFPSTNRWDDKHLRITLQKREIDEGKHRRKENQTCGRSIVVVVAKISPLIHLYMRRDSFSQLVINIKLIVFLYPSLLLFFFFSRLNSTVIVVCSVCLNEQLLSLHFFRGWGLISNCFCCCSLYKLLSANDFPLRRQQRNFSLLKLEINSQL